LASHRCWICRARTYAAFRTPALGSGGSPTLTEFTGSEAAAVHCTRLSAISKKMRETLTAPFAVRCEGVFIARNC
jgi:hypothetical protein